MWNLGSALVSVVERYGDFVTVLFVSGPNAGTIVDDVSVDYLSWI